MRYAPLARTSLILIIAWLPAVAGRSLAADSANSLAKPTPQQYAWHEQERIMFVALDPCTWQGREYDNHSTPVGQINPRKLDTEQWCRAATLWGAKEILFVAKHTGGFCWWQTETGQYGIKETPWKNGRGDVLAELSESCRKHGLNLGVYVYPGDETWGAPIGSGGRTKDPARQEAYNKVFRQQISEVLSRYGRITEVWFDGSCVIEVGDLMRKYAPDAVVFQGPHATIRWPGSESGKLPYPAWNSLRSEDLKTGVATAQHGNPDGDAWAPLEADTPLYNHKWFWSAANEKKRISLDELMDIYYQSVGHGGVLLLNSTPNTEGLIPEDDCKLYAAFGREIDARFGNPVAETKGQGMLLELDIGHPSVIDHAIVMEDYREGERIRRYVLEGLVEGHWQTLTEGTAVGRMKIDVFPPTSVTKVRLDIAKAAAEPLIRRLAVFNVGKASAESPHVSPLPCTGEEQGVRAVGSGNDSNAPLASPSAAGWRKCGSWDAATLAHGRATLTIDLSPFIPVPGQYELEFKKTSGKNDLRIEEIELLYEGELATPGLLTRLQKPNTFNINRTAQVTDETRSAVRVQISGNGGSDSVGVILIRPQPAPGGEISTPSGGAQ